MREILLNQGKVAIVDDSDYEFLNQFKWHAHQNHGRNWYVERLINQDGKRKELFMHRVILNAPKGMETDHINGDGLDNRRCNLRICTTSENQQNQRVQSRAKSSKFKGVSWRAREQKWRAGIQIHTKQIMLGYFVSEIKAALAYDEAAKKYFGEFAKTNFIEV